MSVVRLRPAKGQGSDPPEVRPRSTVSLTDAEAMRLRAALRNLRGIYGNWKLLAEAMGVPHKSLVSFVCGSRNGSPGLALAAARAAATTVEALLGGPRPAGHCPHCGHPQPAEGA